MSITRFDLNSKLNEVNLEDIEAFGYDGSDDYAMKDLVDG